MRLSPCLAVIVVGDDPASSVYVRNKERACAKAGIACKIVRLPETAEYSEVWEAITSQARNPNVHGVIVQLPLPDRIGAEVVDGIPYWKDVDGLSKVSKYMMYIHSSNNDNHIPCTPAGIIKLLEEYHVPIERADVCIIGRSDLVGRPLAHLLEKRNATVTLCHSRTKNLKYHTLRSDVVITAVGKPGIITPDMIMPRTVVIDVGISRVNGKLAGDCDPAVADVAGLFTPVPGGVGPMTVAMLMANTLKACKEANYLDQQR